jgi:hypothetical protein
MKIEILNDSINSPLRFVKKGIIFGQMYNSIDKKYHLAEYIPYKKTPRAYACGLEGNLSASREQGKRNICIQCFLSVLHTGENR